MSEAERLRAWLKAFDAQLEALAFEWKACAEQVPKPHDRLNEIFAQHAQVREERRAVERELRRLGSALGGLPPRERYKRNGHALSAQMFPWAAHEAMRAALSPVLAAGLTR